MSHCVFDSTCFFHDPLCFGGSVPVETRGPGSPSQRMDAPHLLTPRMGRVSTDGDNQGMTFHVEGAAAVKEGIGKPGRIRGLAGGSTGHMWGGPVPQARNLQSVCILDIWDCGHSITPTRPRPAQKRPLALHNNSTYPLSKASLGMPLLLFPLIVSLMTH